MDFVSTFLDLVVLLLGSSRAAMWSGESPLALAFDIKDKTASSLRVILLAITAGLWAFSNFDMTFLLCFGMIHRRSLREVVATHLSSLSHTVKSPLSPTRLAYRRKNITHRE